MATLTSTTIASTYTQLLKITSANLGTDGTAKYIEDGAGTDSALSISTTRVGVGTAAPESALHIDGDAGNVNAKIIVGETNEKFITFGLVSGSDPAYIATDNARELAFGSMTNDHDVAFASEWMRIDNSGKVGIGITVPDSLLHVQAADSTSTGGAKLTLSADDGSAAMASGDRLGAIAFSGTEDASSTMRNGATIECFTDATWSSTENGADIVFSTNDGNNSLTSAMIITAENLVGIGHGVAAPAASLHIRRDGADRAICFSTDGDTPTYTMGVDEDDSKFKIHSANGLANTSDFTIDTSGNVGIGNSSPAVPLHVKAAGTNAGIIIADASTANAYTSFGLYEEGTAKWSMSNHPTTTPVDSWQLLDDGQVARLTVTQTGLIGIGTAAPDFPLHIEAAAAVTVQASTTAQTDTNFCRFQAKSIHTGGSNTVYAEIGNYQHNATEAGDSAVGYIRLQPGDRSYNAYLWIEDDDTLKGSSTLAHIGTTSGIAISAAVTSDERLKDIDSSPFPYGLSDINKLTPIKYKLKDKKVDKLGFGAQTMRDIIPEPVTDTDICIDGYSWEYDEDGNELEQKPKSEGEETKLTMEYHQLIPVLVKAVQELSAKVEALESNNN